MGDQKIQTYNSVKRLVEKGILSPSQIMQQVPSIKSWKTAKKYVREAIETISNGELTKKEEQISILSSLRYLREKIILKLDSTQHLNQYIGGVRQVIEINKQLISLRSLDIDVAVTNQSWKTLMDALSVESAQVSTS